MWGKFLKSTATLSNNLPTGTLLAFQMVAPTLTHDGQCSHLDRILTISFISFLALVSFLLCFTDSVIDSRGKVRYGVATPRGFWIIDVNQEELSNELEAHYRIKAVDFLHAFLTVVVLGTVVFFTTSVDYCFFPESEQTIVVKGILLVVPITVGVICSCLFLICPTKRHGIGFPLSKG